MLLLADFKKFNYFFKIEAFLITGKQQKFYISIIICARDFVNAFHNQSKSLPHKIYNR